MAKSSGSLYDVIVLGSGSAGLTAALYASRALLRTLVVAGYQPGGQLMLTTDVENYPGFPQGILGPELIEKMRKQAERFGAEFIDDDATAVDFKSNPFKVVVDERSYQSNATIIATGASAKWLGLDSELKFRGRGVSSCATCDGFFFRERKVVVVGGGDTAMEESIFLTRFATEVAVIHRRDQLRASKIMQDRAFKNPKIRFIWNSVVEEILGNEKVAGVRIRNVKTDENSIVQCEGVFVAIGYQPNTALFKGQVEMDPRGYIVIQEANGTNIPGVFAAGDVHDYRYRQVATAAGEGCKAAMSAERYLEERGLHVGVKTSQPIKNA